MAKIRIGFGTELNIGSELSGIGTDNPTNTKQVIDNIHVTNAKAVGVSTLATYQGFLDKEAKISHNVDINSQAGTLGEIVIDSEVTVSSGSTLCSSVDELTLTDSFSLPTGNTDSRIHCKTAGSMRFNEDLGTLEFYTGDEWRTVNSFKDIGNRGRGIWMCGFSPNYTSTIGFINIQSKGNEQPFGDSVNGVAINKAGSANAIRGIWGGEQNPSGFSDDMDYVTMASEGDSIDFGDLTQSRPTYGGSFASSTRAIWAGGYASGSGVNTMEYVQIMTLGNALDFGDLHTAVFNQHACSSPTKGFIISGSPSSYSNYQISSIASKGNAMLGGEMTISFGSSAACSNSTRAVVFGGGSPPVDTIDFINLSTTGNAVSFGNLSEVRMLGTAVADGTRAVCVSGRTPSVVNTIEFIQIATGGSAEDFGDMTQPAAGRQKFMACSDSHGGLGGY